MIEPVANPEAIPQRFHPVFNALCHVAEQISLLIARGPLAGAIEVDLGTNGGGDRQKALDVIADEWFATALGGAGVRFYASEERKAIDELDTEGTLAIAIDPLDGSSNLGANVSVGSIFSIFEATDTKASSFLRPCGEQIAAGYFVYGPSTSLLATFGNGVVEYALDPSDRTFRLAARGLQIAPQASEFAINASNYRHWSKPVRAYIDDCLAGEEGPRAKNFNMRWIASLVAETHRIFNRGGIFLYPSDARPGYESGRLRLLYECAPIAFLVEQAGGKATDGCERILDRTIESLHQRTPFVFGTSDKVDRVAAYHDLPEQEVSALFGTRGLFTA